MATYDIQKALDSLPWCGGSPGIPPGVYEIDRPILVPSCVQLGRKGVILRAALGFAGPIIRNRAGATGIIIPDLEIDGRNRVSFAINLKRTHNCIVQNTIIHNVAKYFVKLSYAKNCIVKGNFFDSVLKTVGIGINWSKNGHNRIEDNYIISGRSQLINNYCSDYTVIKGNRLIHEGEGGRCIAIEGATHAQKRAWTNLHIQVKDNLCIGSAIGIAARTHKHGGSISGLEIKDNTMLSAHEYGILVASAGQDKVSGVNLTGNKVSKAGRDGIRLVARKGAELRDIILALNQSWENGRDGIRLSNLQNVEEWGNQCWDNGGKPIRRIRVS